MNELEFEFTFSALTILLHMHVLYLVRRSDQFSSPPEIRALIHAEPIVSDTFPNR